MPESRKLVLASAAVVAAITLALLSAHIERTGPERAAYGNLCGPAGSDPCHQPVLKGGFPLPYLFDAPGISIERHLALIEDKVSVAALVVDIAVYFVIVVLFMLVVSRRWSFRP